MGNEVCLDETMNTFSSYHILYCYRGRVFDSCCEKVRESIPVAQEHNVSPLVSVRNDTYEHRYDDCALTFRWEEYHVGSTQ
jgi:hypothetical protein